MPVITDQAAMGLVAPAAAAAAAAAACRLLQLGAGAARLPPAAAGAALQQANQPSQVCVVAGSSGQQTDQSHAMEGAVTIRVARRIYVGNLSYQTSWQDLKDHFSQARTVDEAWCSRPALHTDA